jgi:hypothetical protein
VAAGANTRVKRFADTCHKNKKGITKDVALEGVTLEGIVLKGVLCRKNGKGEQRREEVVASLVKVKLKQL